MAVIRDSFAPYELKAEYDRLTRDRERDLDLLMRRTVELAETQAECRRLTQEVALRREDCANAMAQRLDSGDMADACPDCRATGVKAYGSTAIWMGGIGGQAITRGVCDKCWGSGDKHRPWPSHRTMLGLTRRAEKAEAEVTRLRGMWAQVVKRIQQRHAEETNEYRRAEQDCILALLAELEATPSGPAEEER